jgi:hypothetical protein
VVRPDAEFAAYIGDDGADRAAANLGGDLLWRWQAGDAGIGIAGAPGRGWGGTRLARWRGADGGKPRFLLLGSVDEPGLERCGAMQALGDAREDQRDIDLAEGPRDGREVVAAVRCCSVAASSLP